MRRWLLWFALGVVLFATSAAWIDGPDRTSRDAGAVVGLLLFAWFGITGWAVFLGGVRWLIVGRRGRL